MIEIERKFLVSKEGLAEAVAVADSSQRIVQGYLASSPAATVRIRLYGDKGFLTIKGKTGPSGMSRLEWEKEISLDEAQVLLTLCGPKLIDKTRYKVTFEGHVFEVDEFHGDNSGLIVAEVELSSEEEAFGSPSWLGKEVTGDVRYYNSALLRNPYNTW